MTITERFPTVESLGAQAFGAMRLEPGHPDRDRDPTAVIHAALDRGIRMIDTADVYQTEELVGSAIQDRRDEVVLATKFGLEWTDQVAAGYRIRAEPDYVRASVDASLARLGADVIDLYYLHHRSEEVPISETVGAMAELVSAGKVRWLGLSNVTAADLRAAHAVHPIAALQDQWSVDQRDIEQVLLPTATELGVTVVAHSPASHGALHTGEHEQSEPLAEIAVAHQATAGQVALAWVHHQHRRTGASVLPLPGTTRVSHLHANVDAASIVLTDEEVETLDHLHLGHS